MSSRYLGKAVLIPAGSINNWRAARAQALAGSARVEVLVASDSTGFGQTPGGAGNEYPWPYRLRALMLGAGMTDGGRGLVGQKNETLASSGDGLIAVSSVTGFATSAGTSADYLLNYTYVSSAAAGESITFTGKGTRIRIWTTANNSYNGSFTYSVDGGGAVTVPFDTTSGVKRIDVSGLTEGTHTVTIVPTGSYSGGAFDNLWVAVTVDFLRDLGLVIHNQSVPGLSSGYVGGNSYTVYEGSDVLMESCFGLVTDRTTGAAGYTHAKDSAAGARSVKLALFALGINNSDVAQIQYSAQKFCRFARAAGADPVLIVQHFEGGDAATAAARRAAVYAAQAAEQAALIDFGVGTLGPASQWVANGYINSIGNPHLTSAGYELQAQRVFDVLMNA